MRCWTAGLLIALGALAGCGPAAAFQCENDLDCLRGSQPPGICQGVGYCSFPDGGCESGQRFGEFGGAFGDKCVPSDGSGSGGGSGSESDSETGGSTASGSSGASDSTEPNTTLGTTTGITTSPDDTGGGESSTGGDPTTGMQPTASELVLWIDFEDGPIDKSEYGHEIACSASCPGTTPGMFGTAGSFGGQHYEVAADPSLDLSGAFTLTVWVRVDDMNALTRSTIFTQETGAGSTSYDVGVQDLDGDATYDLVLTSNESGPGLLDLFPTGAWRFLAIRMDQGQQQVLLDGTEVSSAPLSPVDSHLAPLNIGGIPGIGFPLLGALDDLRLYARILDDVELAAVLAGNPLE